MNIIETIEKRHYVATTAQVAQLATAQYSGAQASAAGGLCYMRVLYATLMHELGIDKKHARLPSSESQMAALNTLQTTYMRAIVEAIATDCDALERNRRTNFARTAKSTLARYIKADGDLRALKVTTLTKASLTEAIHALTGTIAGTQTQPSIVRFIKRLQVLPQRTALKLAEDARDQLTAAILTLRHAHGTRTQTVPERERVSAS